MNPDSIAADHIPVLPKEVLTFLGCCQGVIVDCTLGLGGHSQILLDNSERVTIIGLDVDENNLAAAGTRLARYGERIRLEQVSFAEIVAVLERLGVKKVSGILADLGVSSNQITDPARGLSFEVDGPLDMRLERRPKAE